ncbi:MAG TPA: enoyl-CoA hydratase-related protein [bacterium]|nr:enoyl-CoA hydratase-related protein [bacterium]
MAAPLVTVESRDGIVTLTMRRPEVLNALSSALCRELVAALEAVGRDPAARVLVLTGEGRAFSAGADLKERAGAAEAQIWRHNRAIFQLPLALEALPVPSIAAINGLAVGGGCEVALGCDLRWAADTAELGCPEVTRGIIPAAGGTQRLARLIGPARAMHLVLTGRRITAAEAHRLGLVDAVVPASELAPAVAETARAIAANAPLAVRAARQAIRYGLTHPFEDGLKLEGELQRMLYASDDCREGIAAFNERRAPRWTGR